MACGGAAPPAKSGADGTSGTASATSASSSSGSNDVAGEGGVVRSLKVAPESMKVDKVGGSDGALKPDSAPDIVLDADVEGPVAAVFLISTDAKGDANGEYQADTVTGLHDLPKDFPIAVRAGMLTGGIGVWEGERMLNQTSGWLEPIGPGLHHLKLYVSSTGVLQPGSSHVRLYVMRPDKSVSRGPVADL
jgi:hypothetical protein